MTIALVCPDSFKDYDAVEKALSENKKMTSIVCATTNAYNLAVEFALKFNISHKHIKNLSKTGRLRKMVDVADKVVLFEYSDYDSAKVKFSRTQYALNYLKQIDRALQYIEYDRTMLHKLKSVH